MTRELDPMRSSPVECARGGKGLRYELVGREVKNAVLYDGADCAQTMDSRGSVLEKIYVSRLGNWVPFALALWVAVLKLRFDEAGKLVMLSDGADWIRRLAEWMPCDVLLILDLFHAKKRIWEVAAALWDHTYFTNNSDRMDYAEYRRQGLRISTANVESANFHVTGDRLKKQGMRWSREGASNMSVLRADLFNDRWRERTRDYLRSAAKLPDWRSAPSSHRHSGLRTTSSV